MFDLTNGLLNRRLGHPALVEIRVEGLGHFEERAQIGLVRLDNQLVHRLDEAAVAVVRPASPLSDPLDRMGGRPPQLLRSLEQLTAGKLLCSIGEELPAGLIAIVLADLRISSSRLDCQRRRWDILRDLEPPRAGADRVGSLAPLGRGRG